MIMSDLNIYLSDLDAPVGFYDTTVYTIKNHLQDIAHSYLDVAYNVYLLDKRIKKDGKKSPYSGIVDACQLEFVFKRSTTYNFLNIVKTYGIGKDGKISLDNLLLYGDFGYSQLVEMLSLDSSDRSSIDPDSSVASIKALKKSRKVVSEVTVDVVDPAEVVQTSGLVSEVVANPVDFVQTSGLFDTVHSSDDKMTFTSGDYICTFSIEKSGDVTLDINSEFMSLIDDFFQFVDGFSTDLTVYSDFRNARCSLTDLELSFFASGKFKEFFDRFYPLYSAAYARYLELSSK